MTIRTAEEKDLAVLALHDCHIPRSELKTGISLGRVLIAEADGVLVGWLRWSLFWDNTPFMNLLFLPEGFRGKGYGKKLVVHWEQEMMHRGYKTAMTSTASDEYAQHFYQKLGYTAIGGFTPFEEPYELLFAKKL